MLKIDGSALEGGGQILRTSTALSCLLGKPFTISCIRAGRDRPGLQAQHLAGVRALSRICGAKTEGLELHSTELSFTPGPLCGGSFSFEVGTAGAVTLVAQTLLPVLLFAPERTTITIRGGTHVPFAPTFDYFAHILLPSVSPMGASASTSLSSYGWFPKGGGEIVLTTEPCKGLSALTLLERGELTSLSGVSCSSRLPLHIPQRQASAARARFPQVQITVDSKPADCPGSAITLRATFSSGAVLGSSALGKPGRPAESVGEEAALGLERELASTAPCDSHLADQLMVFMALAKGPSRIRASKITLHAKTNAWLIRQFTGKKVMIDEGSNIIAIEGLGLLPGSPG